MPHAFPYCPARTVTTTKTVSKTTTTGPITEITTTFITTTVIHNEVTDTQPDSRRSSIEMSDEKSAWGQEIWLAAHARGDCVRLFETMSTTAAVAFLDAIASKPLASTHNDGAWESDDDGALLGFHNEGMKQEDKVIIVITDWSGFRSIYRMKRNVYFHELLKTFAEDNYDGLRFLFLDQRLLLGQTPKMAEMAAGKAYDVELQKEQYGGQPGWTARRWMKGGPRFDRNRDW